MICRFLLQILSFCGLVLALSACGVRSHVREGITGQGDFAVRNGVEVDTPSDGVSISNVANYVVLLSSARDDGNGSNNCTGSLINRKIVLTAAHCLAGVTEASAITVVFRKGFENAMSIVGAKFKVHDDANDNDIALIELALPAPEDYRILELPEKLELPAELLVIGAGYGKIHGKYDDSDSAPFILRKVDLTVKNSAGPVLTFGQEAKGLCFGDSGGPGIYTYAGTNYVIGVAKQVEPNFTQAQKMEIADDNFQIEAFRAHHPEMDLCAYKGIYTNVKSYLPWIHETMQGLL